MTPKRHRPPSAGRCRVAKLQANQPLTATALVKHIIGAKPRLAAPEVRFLTVDEDSAGQRLDNFLIRQLKGVPKTHVYRIIRSGEVRVNKGRAAGRHPGGSRRRDAPAAGAPAEARGRAQAGAARAGARIPGPVRRRAPAGHRQAGRRGGARRQRRQLRRDRAVAPGAAAGALPGTGAPARPRNLRHPAGGQEAQRPDGAAGPVSRARDRQDLPGAGRRRLAGQQEGDRRAAAQVPAGRRRAAGAAWSAKDDPDGMRAVTLVKVAHVRCRERRHSACWK